MPQEHTWHVSSTRQRLCTELEETPPGRKSRRSPSSRPCASQGRQRTQCEDIAAPGAHRPGHPGTWALDFHEALSHEGPRKSFILAKGLSPPETRKHAAGVQPASLTQERLRQGFRTAAGQDAAA